MTKVRMLLPLSWDFVPKHTMLSLMGMMRSAERAGFDVDILVTGAGWTDDNREILTRIALEQGTDYLFHIDADQTYPHDSIQRLIAHNKPVVSSLTPNRMNPGMTITFRKGNPDDSRTFMPVTYAKNSGLLLVGATGGGGVMVNCDVFETMLKPPFFARMEDPKSGHRFGEDLAFFWRCWQAGIDCYVDTDVCNGHVVTGVIECE